MEFSKVFSDGIDHGYAVMRMHEDAGDYILAASEEDAPCYAYDLNDDCARTTVWPDVGGTMTMVQIPGSLDFLATQRFYPGFNSKQCRLIRARFHQGAWSISPVQDFPYLHRFDIIEKPGPPGHYWFVGCTIANSKQYTDDWSDPGKVFVGDYDAAKNSIDGLHALPVRITKNHGYRRLSDGSGGLITGASGIFKLFCPTEDSDWKIDQVADRETSDIAFVDINQDGLPEYLAIEGFHGSGLRLYDHDFSTMQVSTEETPFGHAIDGVNLLGEPCFLFGHRAGSQNLLALYWRDGSLQPRIIDEGVGPSNVLTYSRQGKAYLLSANRERNELAIYLVSE